MARCRARERRHRGRLPHPRVAIGLGNSLSPTQVSPEFWREFLRAEAARTGLRFVDGPRQLPPQYGLFGSRAVLPNARVSDTCQA